MTIIIIGKPGEGKTALAHLIYCELTASKLPSVNTDEDVPYNHIQRLDAIRDQLRAENTQIVISTKDEDSNEQASSVE